MFHCGLEQTPPFFAVRAQRIFGTSQIALQHDRRAVVERMRERRFAMNPFQSQIRQRQFGKERRPGSKWMHRRSHVVQKSRQRQRHGSRRPAGLGLCLENLDLRSRCGEHNRRGQSIRARSNYAGATHLSCSPCPFTRAVELPAPGPFSVQSCGSSSGGHSTTANFSPATSVSSGAYRPISSRRHQLPVCRFSLIEVNQYCHSSART